MKISAPSYACELVVGPEAPLRDRCHRRDTQSRSDGHSHPHLNFKLGHQSKNELNACVGAAVALQKLSRVPNLAYSVAEASASANAAGAAPDRDSWAKALREQNMSWPLPEDEDERMSTLRSLELSETSVPS